MAPRPRWSGPPPPETKIIPANRWPDCTTSRPSDPLYLPTSMGPLTVNDGPSRIRKARLLPPSATLKWFTSTFVWARITWLGLSCVPLIRASAVRDGSVPPHMAAVSQEPHHLSTRPSFPPMTPSHWPRSKGLRRGGSRFEAPLPRSSPEEWIFGGTRTGPVSLGLCSWRRGYHVSREPSITPRHTFCRGFTSD